MSILDRIIEDLDTSSLEQMDLGVIPIDNTIRAATNTPASINGYKIPYLNIWGNPVPHYRVKLFDFEPKYKQPKDSANYVFFPPNFLKVAAEHNYVILTEGEKKAALAVKLGFPAASIGGVDSWKNRIISLPEGVELTAQDKRTQARLPAGGEMTEDFLSPLAIGLQELIDYALSKEKHFIILFDNDLKQETNHNVQRAAATLGYELRFRGLAYDRIRQIRLPYIPGSDKVGLDDYLIQAGENFNGLIRQCLQKRSAFPRHPNVRDYVNKRLQKAKMSRREMQQVSMAILSELDANGLRLRSSQTMETYYFDLKTHKLLKAIFSENPNALTDNAFGQFLYRSFGIGAADNRLIQWLGTQFTGEEPISEVSPYRVLARPTESTNKDSVVLQISDGSYAEVHGGETSQTIPDCPGLEIRDNGSNNILFEAGQVTPIDPRKLAEEYSRQYKQVGTITSWWADVLSETRLADQNKTRILTALLFYAAPWLLRWRGTQLPIEMTLGEAGSGKSTLQELRLQILTGIPSLRNAPQDIKDWQASVASTGGLHVIDNLQLPDKNLRQRISDEICRIITEPNPTIEQRKLYTNADVVYLPVRCQFGITAIRQPFLNSDVLARAYIIELDKSSALENGNIAYDAHWKETQLQRFGGREAWLAHHLLVLHQFFKLVKQKWNHRYSAKHRLINFEQTLTLMAEVFNLKIDWIPDKLQGIMNVAVRDADWAFEGLVAWAAENRGYNRFWTAADIADWASDNEEYSNCEELTNSRRCGRYIITHKAFLSQSIGLQDGGKENNRARYILATKDTKRP